MKRQCNGTHHTCRILPRCRLNKEYEAYKAEASEQKKKVETMIASGMDEYDIKKQVRGGSSTGRPAWFTCSAACFRMRLSQRLR